MLASGVAALAIAAVAVPAALSGSASAKTPSTASPVVTACKPTTATIGKSVTIHGTGLAKAKSVSIGTTKKDTIAVTSFTKDSKKSIKLKIPTGVKAGSEKVTVTTDNGTSTAFSCTFQKAKNKK